MLATTQLVPSIVYLDIVHIHVAVRSIAEAREQLVLYTVPGSIWPTNSLLDKFRSSVIEMKSATLAPQDTAVSLKA